MIFRMHAFLERFNAGHWEHVPVVTVLPKNDEMLSWLAGVRQGIAPHVPSVAAGRNLPADISGPVALAYTAKQDSAFGMSWVAVQELLDFDYDAAVIDLRPAYAATGKTIHYHDMLGVAYQEHLARLSRANPGRVVFWFECLEPSDEEGELN